MKVLVIEDDTTTRDFVVKGLREHQFVVDEAEDGQTGLMMAVSCEYQLIVLDRMLPGLDGLKILNALRATDNAVPVLILSAMDAVEDRVQGLQAGSDDYLVKPFALSELVARAQTLLRRSQPSQNSPVPDTVLSYKDVSLDLRSHRVKRAGTDINLQPKEFQLLLFLLENAEQVVSRMRLFEAIWNYHFDPKTNVIDVHVANLRKKLAIGGLPDLIHTIRGAGYVLRE